MNRGQLRSAVYAHLGTSSTDRGFPPDRLNQWIQDVVNRTVDELPPGYRQQAATWTASGATSRQYVLASQATPVTALGTVLRVCLDTTDGLELRQVAFDQLRMWSGLAYAVTGADESATLHTNLAVEAGAPLYVEFEIWPADLADDAASPSTIPARFHDLLALRVAKIAFASGDEGRFPVDLQDLLELRQAQFWTHTARRSPDPSIQRRIT